ncbi:MAG: NAD-dependent DNA ligase LigA [Deltaproteobacteria bacterium]|nr:NAD-dependent DNA ligase LigA [Deltaproteobacteria bacterium]
MNPELFRSRYNQLVIDINHHNQLYYSNNSPIISDEEYDRLYRELKELEEQFPELISEYSPTRKIGNTEPENIFKKTLHTRKMLSLSNTYNFNEVLNFFNRITKALETEKLQVVCEPKFDGISIELVYEKGKLKRAVTRGDGITGDDVTANVMQIKTIPHHLKGFSGNLSIRGEIFMNFSAFEKLNEERQIKGEKLFMNPRNAAGGTLHLKDTSEVSKRPLDIFVYDLLSPADHLGYHDKMIDFFMDCGLPVYSRSDVFDIEDIINIKTTIDDWDKKRKNLEFPIDGLVFKLNSFSQRDSMGTNIKDPKWGFAYKFPSDEMETKLLDIELNVGRTGSITPVAVLDPVLLDGTRVSRASLHNFEYIKEKNLMLNDIVKVKKAGEIIPQVISSVLHTPESIEIKEPELCPACGNPLQRKNTTQKIKSSSEETETSYIEEKNIRCINHSCPSRLKNSLIHFVSRDMMNIEAIGEKLIEQMFSEGLIRRGVDIYKLTRQQILSLERKGEKSADIIITSIEKSRHTQLNRVINAIGIPGTGKANSRNLSEKFHTIDNLLEISKNIDSFREELLEIDGIGDNVANEIISFFSNDDEQSHLEELSEVLVFQDLTSSTGKIPYSFCITGTLSKPRRELEEIILKNGGNIKNDVSSKLDYLLCGENSGSKLKKAEKLGVKIMAESEFWKILS